MLCHIRERKIAMDVTLYVDGGTIGQNGRGATGVYYSVGRELGDGSIEPVVHRRTSDAHKTNNEAEWLAVLDALQEAAHIEGMESLTICSDSQLVVNQFKGRWKTKTEKLTALKTLAKVYAERLGVPVEVVWVPRAENVTRLGH